MGKQFRVLICAAAICTLSAFCTSVSASRAHQTHQHASHNAAHPGNPHEEPVEVIEGGSRHMQAHQKPEGKTAMSNWLPGWWSNELSHWQEFPTNDYDEAFPFHGQDWEDQYAHDFFFYNKKHGTYLEMGGYDGLTFTNTLWLNKALGWHGMLIEASPVQYPKMTRNRKDDIGLWVAACDSYQDVHWVDTGVTAGIVEFMSDSFKREWHKKMDVSTLEVIPCMPLSSILSKFGVHQLDFWSLDVEGGEMQVLQTFDFDAVHISVICLEADGHSPAKDEAVVAFMKSKGYLYHGHVDRNDWFTHPDFIPAKSPIADSNRAAFRKVQEENWASWLKQLEEHPELERPDRE